MTIDVDFQHRIGEVEVKENSANVAYCQKNNKEKWKQRRHSHMENVRLFVMRLIDVVGKKRQLIFCIHSRQLSRSIICGNHAFHGLIHIVHFTREYVHKYSRHGPFDASS